MYTVEVIEEAADQIAALPGAALPGLAELIDLLELDPWSGTPYHRSLPHGGMRSHTFGPADAGMLVTVIDERGRRVFIVRVTWIG